MPRQNHFEKFILNIITVAVFLALIVFGPQICGAGDGEYLGTFETELVARTQDMDQVTFRPVRDVSKIKTAKPLQEGDKITAGRLYHPPSDKSSILTLLVEPEDGPPYLYADRNLDGTLGE